MISSIWRRGAVKETPRESIFGESGWLDWGVPDPDGFLPDGFGIRQEVQDRGGIDEMMCDVDTTGRRA
jgi:hypothetical protein